MKKSLLQFIALSAVTLTANAQLEMGTQFSQLKGHGNNDNHSSLIGIMTYTRYHITDRISVGSVLHVYKPRRSKQTDGNMTYFATDNVTNVASTFDVMVGDKTSAVQPYVGVDMGLSKSTHNIDYTNDQNKVLKFNMQRSYAMVSPKLGVNMAVGHSIGIYAQLQYNYSPGNGDPVKIKLTNAKYTYVLTTEPISKYINIDAGLSYKIGNIKEYVKKWIDLAASQL